jgi:hypothetical protein
VRVAVDEVVELPGDRGEIGVSEEAEESKESVGGRSVGDRWEIGGRSVGDRTGLPEATLSPATEYERAKSFEAKASSDCTARP